MTEASERHEFPQTTCKRIKDINVLQSIYKSIPTGHFIIRRSFRPKSKSAQPKGRRIPFRRSSRCLCFGCASVWQPNMRERETSVRELEHSVCALAVLRMRQGAFS
ncbi:uncharacterized protein V6R79_020816 [Siganus canaliculatus]